MNEETINIIDNTIQAIAILNKTEDYFDELDDNLSICDKLRSDFEHIIETHSIDSLNLPVLFKKMQDTLIKRRRIKRDKSLAVYFMNNSGKLSMKINRGFLLQGLKNLDNKTDTDYKNRILSDEELTEIMTKETKRGRGRPKKVKEGV